MAGDKNTLVLTFDEVAALYAALKSDGVNIGQKHYKIMADICATRTASGYEHAFRAVKQKAKEICDQMEKGGLKGTDAKPKSTPRKKAGEKEDTPKTGGKSGGKKGKRGKSESDADDEEDAKASPTKKMKAEQEEDSMAAAGGELSGAWS